MLDNINRIIDMAHQWVLTNTFERYVPEVRKSAVTTILRIWRDKIEAFESTDPTCIAEREVRGFTYMLHRMLEDADVTLAKFQKNFTADPFYALDNRRHAMEAAAEKHVATWAAAMLEAHSVDEVKAEATRRLRYADGFRLSESTCPTTNLMHRA